MRVAGITVNNIPKIQVKEPTVDDHALIFSDKSLRITLSLKGIFSTFGTRAPTADKLDNCEEVYWLTPDSEHWNPNSRVYAENEQNMVDWQGKMVELKDQVQLLLSNIPDNVDM